MSSGDFIGNLLRYHKNLVDHDFVERLINRIDKSYRFRQWILTLCTLIGLIFGGLGITLLMDHFTLSLYSEHPLFATLASTLVITVILFFLYWLFDDEFEIS
ncbi:hypothetical protein [Pleionea sediminis]|uniref:hypothetical protein n=1 Tax=Pleionea sediminis TaxID=2569479 RepID=UPI001184DDE0|nr:hypothetical protein [Pleionea sediminis]